MRSHYELLSFFSQSLAHRIRSPLSVISNELSVLRSTVNAESVQILAQKCSQISEILKESTALGRTEFRTRLMTPADICKELAIEPLSIQIESTNTPVAVDLEKLRLALKLLQESIHSLGYHHFTTSAHTSEKQFILQFSFSPSHNTHSPNHDITYCSLTELFTSGYNADSILPPLVDAVLFRHGCDITVKVQNHLIVEVLFSVVHEP